MYQREMANQKYPPFPIPEVLACLEHHRESNDSLVVVLNPPTVPSRVRGEQEKERGGCF